MIKSTYISKRHRRCGISTINKYKFRNLYSDKININLYKPKNKTLVTDLKVNGVKYSPKQIAVLKWFKNLFTIDLEGKKI